MKQKQHKVYNPLIWVMVFCENRTCGFLLIFLDFKMMESLKHQSGSKCKFKNGELIAKDNRL